jgi:ribosomal protein S18 acetylase RimI-like enzyme
MRIVQATQQDLDSVYHLNQQIKLWLPNYRWDRKWWIQEEIEAGNFHVLTNPQVVGALCLNLDDAEQGYIETITLHPEQHGRGLGRKLVNFAVQQSKNAGKSFLTVGSFCRYNVKDFYLKCGFQLESIDRFEGCPYYQFSMEL